jgi:hypothetical protein
MTHNVWRKTDVPFGNLGHGLCVGFDKRHGANELSTPHSVSERQFYDCYVSVFDF